MLKETSTGAYQISIIIINSLNMFSRCGVLLLLQVISTVLCVSVVEYVLENGDGCYHTSKYSPICYTIPADSRPWSEVQAACNNITGLKNITGNFTIIHDQATQDIVEGAMKATSTSLAVTWLGASQSIGNWSWIAIPPKDLNSSLEYWQSGRPKASNQVIKNDCVMMVRTKAFKWQDAGCTFATNFVCQADNTSSACSDSSFALTLDISGSCFLFNHNVKTWFEARAFCDSIGAKLAWVDSETIYNTLVSQQPGALQNKDTYLIGLTRAVWSWYTGEQVILPFWGITQPSGVGTCAALTKFSATVYRWSSESCSKTNRYVCEVEAPPFPFIITTPVASSAGTTLVSNTVTITNSSMEQSSTQMTPPEAPTTSSMNDTLTETVTMGLVSNSTVTNTDTNATNADLTSNQNTTAKMPIISSQLPKQTSSDSQPNSTASLLQASTAESSNLPTSVAMTTSSQTLSTTGPNGSSFSLESSRSAMAIALSLGGVLIGFIAVVGVVLACRNRGERHPSRAARLKDSDTQTSKSIEVGVTDPVSYRNRYLSRLSSSSASQAVFIADSEPFESDSRRPSSDSLDTNLTHKTNASKGSAASKTSIPYTAWRPRAPPMHGLPTAEYSPKLYNFHWRTVR